MQIVDLDLDHFNFFCPVTGKTILSEDEPYQPSPATVFCYVDEGGAFESISAEAKAIYDKLNLDDIYMPDDIFQSFAGELQDPNIVCFVITNSGMACGPVSFTVRIGIQMNYNKDQ